VAAVISARRKRSVLARFAEKRHRDRKKHQVKYFAFLLRDIDAADGLSVGLSLQSSVKHLVSNEGCCRLSVRAVHELPYGLQVRKDPTDGDHAFICNLPLMTISDDQGESSRLVAGELARRAEIITCDCIALFGV
jgi:hypothetical protein